MISYRSSSRKEYGMGHVKGPLPQLASTYCLIHTHARLLLGSICLHIIVFHDLFKQYIQFFLIRCRVVCLFAG